MNAIRETDREERKAERKADQENRKEMMEETMDERRNSIWPGGNEKCHPREGRTLREIIVEMKNRRKERIAGQDAMEAGLEKM
jgi:hypothetical protein